MRVYLTEKTAFVIFVSYLQVPPEQVPKMISLDTAPPVVETEPEAPWYPVFAL